MAHTVKAYMSEVEVWHCDLDAWDKASLALGAEREAARILADVEPAGDPGYSECRRLADLHNAWLPEYPTYNVDPYLGLLESLAAFVNAPVQG